jgi:hypothetical protein
VPTRKIILLLIICKGAKLGFCLWIDHTETSSWKRCLSDKINENDIRETCSMHGKHTKSNNDCSRSAETSSET